MILLYLVRRGDEEGCTDGAMEGGRQRERSEVERERLGVERSRALRSGVSI